MHMVKLDYFLKESVHEGKLPPLHEFPPLKVCDSFRFRALGNGRVTVLSACFVAVFCSIELSSPLDK
jgi:hypothetical protein